MARAQEHAVLDHVLFHPETKVAGMPTLNHSNHCTPSAFVVQTQSYL